MFNLTASQIIWLCIGFSGQLLFSLRFLIQWLQTERQRKSVVPVAFWYFSIFGSLSLLIYAIHLRDPVIISGQLFGFIVYIRNLYFIYSEQKHTQLIQEKI
ncbi:MAG: hypothetical protein A3E83_08270 [Gammaproteobacteria bacterium RIFCSPHIGHO2_12_FULL_41_20]|nr:MAG: hypothetical protein A3E83_08270 [Gammaproteobacteria bacterium RIFCSPHIGHO2_12_FULL_41_20]